MRAFQLAPKTSEFFAVVFGVWSFGCGSKCKVWIKPRSHKRSRPLIQTPDPDLSKGVDPDLWSRPLEWYFLWASWCLQLFTLPSSQATNCFKATLPSCQASKLHFLQSHAAKLSSCQAAKLHVLLSHAFKLSNCNCSQATKLSSYQADIVARPGCQAAKVSTCCLHLVVLFLSPCIQAATYTKKVGSILRPGRSRPGSRPIQTRSRPQPAPCTSVLKTCDCLVSFLASSCWFTIHEIWNFYSRSLRLSMWPLV